MKHYNGMLLGTTFPDALFLTDAWDKSPQGFDVGNNDAYIVRMTSKGVPFQVFSRGKKDVVFHMTINSKWKAVRGIFYER